MKGWVGLVGWPYSGWFTHMSGHPSATGRAWDRESSPVKDRRTGIMTLKARGPMTIPHRVVVVAVCAT